MINSKGIKILCYVLMGIVWTASVMLFFGGVANVFVGNIEWYYGAMVAGGIILPIVTTVSLYPLFALANIDEHLKALNSKVDKVLKNQKPRGVMAKGEPAPKRVVEESEPIPEQVEEEESEPAEKQVEEEIPPAKLPVYNQELGDYLKEFWARNNAAIILLIVAIALVGGIMLLGTLA